MTSLTETFLRMGGPLGDYLGDQMRLRQLAMNAEQARQQNKMAELEMTLRKKQQERIEKEHQIEALTKATGDFEKMIFDSAYTGGTMDEATAKGKWDEIAKRYGIPADQLPAVDFNRLNDISWAAQQKRMEEQARRAEQEVAKASKGQTEEMRRQLIQAKIDELKRKGAKGTGKGPGISSAFADKAEALIQQAEGKWSSGSPNVAVPLWTKGAPTPGQMSEEEAGEWSKTVAETGKNPKEYGVKFRPDVFRHKLPRYIMSIPGMKPEWAQAWLAREQGRQATTTSPNTYTQAPDTTTMPANDEIVVTKTNAPTFVKKDVDKQTGKPIEIYLTPDGRYIAVEVD